MHVTVIEPPDPLVTRTEAKRHLRVDLANTDDDALIDGLIAGACGLVDGPGASLGRSIGEQTLEARFDEFGADDIVLPYGPILSVTSVKYLDGLNVEQTVGTDIYQRLSDGRVRLVTGAAWPTIFDDEEAVRVRYVAGYEDIPAPVKSAVLLMVGYLYANREASTEDALQSGAVAALLAPYRVWSV